MLKAGIIGCGRIVQEGHARAFEALKDKVTVTALADPAPECLVAIGEALGVPEDGHYASAAELLEEMQINYILTLLIGAPGEDRQTVGESVEFLSRQSPMIVDFCVGIRLMPHTALSEIAVREGVIAADDPLMEPRFYISPQIEDWIEGYLREACAPHPNWTVGSAPPESEA